METEATPEATKDDQAPGDPITWAKKGDENSWHIVKSISGDQVEVLDGDTLVMPEFRADLGAEKSCETCMKRWMQRNDL